ncbi:MAG TPA: hypothetical protein VFN42_00415 [Acetobacteraceae bacterium]|nr:hypothetical protein [Acetobacteraceae bacterium]
MSDKPQSHSAPNPDRPAKKRVRLQREAAALRENLRKRKEQARERAVERPPPKQD